MILGDAEEVHTNQSQEKVTRNLQTIFLRGDQIVHFSPITMKMGI
jgi:small nuclear ribonucleoprotein (snRNP)-like protein